MNIWTTSGGQHRLPAGLQCLRAEIRFDGMIHRNEKTTALLGGPLFLRCPKKNGFHRCRGPRRRHRPCWRLAPRAHRGHGGHWRHRCHRPGGSGWTNRPHWPHRSHRPCRCHWHRWGYHATGATEATGATGPTGPVGPAGPGLSDATTFVAGTGLCRGRPGAFYNGALYRARIANPWERRGPPRLHLADGDRNRTHRTHGPHRACRYRGYRRSPPGLLAQWVPPVRLAPRVPPVLPGLAPPAPRPSTPLAPPVLRGHRAHWPPAQQVPPGPPGLPVR